MYICFCFGLLSFKDYIIAQILKIFTGSLLTNLSFEKKNPITFRYKMHSHAIWVLLHKMQRLSLRRVPYHLKYATGIR